MIIKIFTISLLLLVAAGNIWLAIDMGKESAKKLIKGRQSSEWAAVAGQIQTSAIVDTGPAYLPQITYRYEVLGVVYTGNTVDFSIYALSYGDAEKITNDYCRQCMAYIYYDPSRPEISALITGAKTENYIAFAVSLFWLVVPPYALMLGLRSAYALPSSKYKQSYIDAINKLRG